MKDQLQQVLYHVKEKGVSGDANLILLDDDSIITVLEINSLPFYELKKNRQEEITEKYNQLFLGLDFPIDIVIRPVNNAVDKRVIIMEKLLTYNINQSEKTSLIEFNERFFKWLNAYIKREIKEAYAYYAVIKIVPSLNKEMQVKDAVSKINQRLNFFTEAIHKTGAKSKQLSSDEMMVVYSSYIKPYLYRNGEYLFPEDWINLFKKENASE